VTQLRQVVMNLITNAAEAIGDADGVITITTGARQCDTPYLKETYLDDNLPAGEYVFIEVSDTGKGMDVKTRERIFDPFFTTKSTGRGLGLSAVLGIVRGHHGALICNSELGRGTTFRLMFPASTRPAPTEQPPTRDLEEWRGAGLALVVDDETTVRELAARILKRAGFEVLTAGDGMEALDIFQRRADDITIVILDMSMPILSGPETYRELKKHRPGVRVLLSSGYNEQEAVHRFAGGGLAGFIQKPYRVTDFLAAIRQAVSG